MELATSALRLLVIALGTGVGLYLALYLFQRLTPGIDEWGEVVRGNVAAGLMLASVALAVAIVVRPIVAQPLSGMDLRAGSVVVAVFVEGARLLLGLLLAVGAVALASWLYNLLTRGIQERAQLRLGNVAVGLIQAAIIVSTALMISAPGAAFVQALIGTLFR